MHLLIRAAPPCCQTQVEMSSRHMCSGHHGEGSVSDLKQSQNVSVRAQDFGPQKKYQPVLVGSCVVFSSKNPRLESLNSTP